VRPKVNWTYKFASLKRSMRARGIFAAVTDLFNSKILGDIIWHKKDTMNSYKLKLFNKIEFIIYIAIKVCFTLHLGLYAGEMDFFLGALGILILQKYVKLLNVN
jgi:hypothetical protein